MRKGHKKWHGQVASPQDRVEVARLVARQGSAPHVQVAQDPPYRLMLIVVESVNLVQAVGIQHGSLVGQGGGEYQSGVLFKKLLTAAPSSALGRF